MSRSKIIEDLIIATFILIDEEVEFRIMIINFPFINRTLKVFQILPNTHSNVQSEMRAI